MRTSDVKPGDTVELKDKEGGFTDPETGFDISRDQKVKLGETIGQRTHTAILSGGLLVVGKPAKNLGEDSGESEPAKTKSKK